MDKYINLYDPSITNEIISIIKEILQSKSDNISRGIFISGNSGIGKTTFILNLLKENNYDVIYYDGSDIRNKNLIENIADNNIAQYNVSKLFIGEQKQIVIVMDDIENMNTGDKGGINALCKLIRPKKTKKQKHELKTTNPIICISSNYIDKKITEIMKGCHIISIPTPPISVLRQICINANRKEINDNILESINGDLRKLNLYINNKVNNCHHDDYINQYDVKLLVDKLYTENYALNKHTNIINDNDRTIVALIYHENLSTILNKLPISVSIPLYLKILHILCHTDFIDRVTFQKQIWQFNEISSLLKTFQINNILHENVMFPSKYIKGNDIIFTKVLTKYSSEYNNFTFFQTLSFKLNQTLSSIISNFITIRDSIHEYYEVLNSYDISSVDINRIYRYIDNIENYTL